MGTSFHIRHSVAIDLVVALLILGSSAATAHATPSHTPIPGSHSDESNFGQDSAALGNLRSPAVMDADQGAWLLSSADNFNPKLSKPVPPPVVPPPPAPKSKPPAPAPQTVQSHTPTLIPQDLKTDVRLDRDNSDQRNFFLEATPRFKLPNGDILQFTTGRTTFREPGINSIVNIPLRVGWEKQVQSVKIQSEVGVDLFDRLAPVPNFNLNVSAPVSPSASLVGIISYGAYKVNAKTLEQEISALRVGPNFFWQLDRNTSFFSFYRFGHYSDGNLEHQIFGRLEHRLGQFSIAANAFSWSYQQDVSSTHGYFSPPDFLVYNAELAWEGNPFDFLHCRLSANLGKQRLNGVFSNANLYTARCTATVTPKVEADLGYTTSNINDRSTNSSPYRSESITGQIRVKF